MKNGIMDLEKLLWARNYHLKNGCLPRMSFWDKKMYLSNIMLLGAGSNFAAAGNTHSIDLERDLSQYLTAADSASLSITGDITIECWAKAESAAPNNDTMTLVSKLATVSNNHSFIFYFEDDAGTDYLYFAYSDDGTSADTAITRSRITHTQSVGSWVHYAVAVTVATQVVDFYVNGTNTTGTNTLTGGTSIFDSTALFAIGGGNQNGNGTFFDGLIDDVRIWATKRTTAQIQDNRSKELVGNETNLNGYWKLNNNLDDATANNNGLTNNGTAVFSTVVPF